MAGPISPLREPSPFMKIGPTVWKIQALKCLKITQCDGRPHFDLAFT